MQTITPFLWFDDAAEEAVHFYTSIFEHAKVGAVTRYDAAGAKVSGRKQGSVMTIGFQLCGQEFVALNGGPVFTFTPAISFSVHCASAEEVDTFWNKLVDGGKVMMELGAYPFSKRYGWLADKYGVSWQLNAAPRAQKMTPSLMFVGENAGRAEEAMRFYKSIFPDANIQEIHRYEQGESAVDKVGTVKHAVFTLAGREFIAMDSAHQHLFSFSEAISFVVHCDTQEEIDRYWEKLSAHEESEQCGWLKDTYGVSWQIVPTVLEQMIGDKDPAKAARAMEAMLRMKKLDIDALKRAYEAV